MSEKSQGEKAEKPEKSRSLIALIRELPAIMIALVKAELRAMIAELVRKAKYAGIGIGLFGFAAIVGFFLIGVLIAAAVLGLAVVFPGWLAALLVAAGMLVVILVAVLVGVALLKKGMPLAPTETIQSLKSDVDAVKGRGTYDK